MHSVFFKLIVAGMGLGLLLGSGCTKKPKENPAEEKPTVMSDVAPVQEVIDEPEIPRTELKPPEYDKSKAGVPVPVSLTALSGLGSLRLEEALLNSFAKYLPEDDETVKKVKSQADKGVPWACEQMALYYMAFPSTDPRYGKGIEYLKKIDQFESVVALDSRALIEYGNNPQNIEKAKPFFVQALEKNEESTLQYLIEHPEFGMGADAWERLKNIYTSKAEQNDPEATFNLAKLYSIYPGKADDKHSEQLLGIAVKLGYKQAIIVTAYRMLRNGQYKEGLDLMKQAAEDSDEANTFLALIYLAASVNGTAEKASDFAKFPISDEFLQILKADLVPSKKPEQISEGDVRLITAYARKGMGMEQACKILFSLSVVEGELGAYNREQAVLCMEKYIKLSQSRIACDNIDNIYGGMDVSLYESLFSEQQKKRVSNILIECLQTAVTTGQCYAPGMAVISTPLKLAMLYGGDIDKNITANPTLALQYTMLATTQCNDPIAQHMLAQSYIDGDLGRQDVVRACYWGSKVRQNKFCTEQCALLGDSELTGSLSEDEMQSFMMGCFVCQENEKMMNQYCG